MMLSILIQMQFTTIQQITRVLQFHQAKVENGALPLGLTFHLTHQARGIYCRVKMEQTLKRWKQAQKQQGLKQRKLILFLI